MNDCPYVYYVHCFAHRLQLALVASVNDVIHVGRFFTKLTWIVNIVSASCKRNNELKATHASDIEYLISVNELQIEKKKNPFGTVQQAEDTRWSSHLKSVSSLLNMYNAACTVLFNVFEAELTSKRGEACSAHKALVSFEFVFILHVMRTMLGITDLLCQNFQCKTQDILNAMKMVVITMVILRELRDNKFDYLLGEVKSFCEAPNVDIPDLSAQYVSRYERGRNDFSVEKRYRVDIFYVVIDSQLQETNRRFSDPAVELLSLSFALNPRDQSSAFRIDVICEVVNKFYPKDFTEIQLRVEL